MSEQSTGRTLKNWKETPLAAPGAVSASTPFQKAPGFNPDNFGRARGTSHSHRQAPPSSGGTYLHPFKLALTGDGWCVNESGSSIIDGTNGTKLAITGLGTERSTTGRVAVKVTIVSDEASAQEVEVGGYDNEEVEFDASSPYDQTFAWLYIGTVTAADGSFTFMQATTTAQMLTHGIVNGKEARCFLTAPSHPDSFV